MVTRAEMLGRIAAWLEEERPDDDLDEHPTRELHIEHGVSSDPEQTWTVCLDDTGAWAREHDRWETLAELGDGDAERGPEPDDEWWIAWGAGDTLDEALAACLADLDRPTWGRAP